MTGVRAVLDRAVRFETHQGAPWTDGSFVVTPLAGTMTVGAGLGIRGLTPSDPDSGLLRHSWPSAVEVASGGRTERIPIFDVTRLGQLAIILAALLFMLEMRARTRAGKER